MADLDTKFRGLNRVRGPDLWPDIEARQPRPMPEGGAGRRLAAGAVALVLAAGGAVLVARAFLGDDRPAERQVQPAESPAAAVEPVVDVTLPIKWPSSIVYGEGSIWVAVRANDGTGAGTVYRFHPDTAEIMAEISVPSVPTWETGGGGMDVANGSLWIAGYLDEGDQAGLLRIDTSTNEVADVVPLGGAFAGDVEVDEHGVWVTVFAGSSVDLVRLELPTLELATRTDLMAGWAHELLTISAQVWVEISRGVLLKIDPETGFVLMDVKVPGGATSFTTSDGIIWANTWKADDGNLLARIDPASGDLDLLPSDSLDYLVESGEGGLWGRGRRIDDVRGKVGIVRFDPGTVAVDASVELADGQNPIDLAIAPGSVWVIHYQEGVTRVELRPQ